jgi:hypothetical protein
MHFQAMSINLTSGKLLADELQGCWLLLNPSELSTTTSNSIKGVAA